MTALANHNTTCLIRLSIHIRLLCSTMNLSSSTQSIHWFWYLIVQTSIKSLIVYLTEANLQYLIRGSLRFKRNGIYMNDLVFFLRLEKTRIFYSNSTHTVHKISLCQIRKCGLLNNGNEICWRICLSRQINNKFHSPCS